MSEGNSNHFSPPSMVCPADRLDERIQYSLLDTPYLDLEFIEPNPLGITYDEQQLGEITNYFTPSLNYALPAPTEIPFRPSIPNDTLQNQPALHFIEPTPTTPDAPAKLCTQMPIERVDTTQPDFWSPCSLVSASSLSSNQHRRSQSFSGPLQHLITPQQTPKRRIKRAKSVNTPRKDAPACSPLPSDTWTPDHLAQSPLQHSYVPIAPNPGKRRRLKHSDDGEDLERPSIKKFKAMSPAPSVNVDMSSEDKLLLQLRDEEKLSWKDIVTKFAEDLKKDYHPAALQMRIKRLRDRLRVWTDSDIQALHLAHQYYMETKFEIIASKMLEFGSSEKWSAKQCQQKWSDLCSSSEFVSGPSYSTLFCTSPVTNLSRA